MLDSSDIIPSGHGPCYKTLQFVRLKLFYSKLLHSKLFYLETLIPFIEVNDEGKEFVTNLFHFSQKPLLRESESPIF